MGDTLLSPFGTRRGGALPGGGGGGALFWGAEVIAGFDPGIGGTRLLLLEGAGGA